MSAKKIEVFFLKISILEKRKEKECDILRVFHKALQKKGIFREKNKNCKFQHF